MRGWGMVLGIDEKFIFREKNGCTPNYFVQKIGGTRPGRPPPKNLVIRGYPQFFEKKLGVPPFFFQKS